MVSFIGVSSVHFDDELLRKVALSVRAASGSGYPVVTVSGEPEVDVREIEEARRLVAEYFAASDDQVEPDSTL